MSGKRVSTGKVLFHFLLVCVTGGVWLLWLIVRYLLGARD